MTKSGQVPPAPEGLTGNAALAWGAMARTISGARPISDADRLKMEAAATAWARWRTIEGKIAQLGGQSNPLAGELTKSASGALQASALRVAASQALGEFNSLAAALGVDARADLTTIDLFGYPDRPGRGQKGRPSFRPSPRDRNRVRLLLAMGWGNPRIADALEVSLPTLHKYFKTEIAERDKMRDRLDARRLELAMEEANLGNISALRELGRLIERNDRMEAERTMGEQPKKPVPVGKKDLDRQLAKDADAHLAEELDREAAAIVRH